MWNGNNMLHQITETEMERIDKIRIKNGLEPLWQKDTGEIGKN